MKFQDSITVETSQFNHTEVKPHFINPNCFGEDFAEWLILKLEHLKKDGFEISAPIQEDYGWGFWVSKERETFWVAIGIIGDGQDDEIPQWNISINYDAGLNLIKRLFHKPDAADFERIRNSVFDILKNSASIKVVE